MFRWLNRLKIAHKLAVGYGISLALAILVGLLSGNSLYTMYNQAKSVESGPITRLKIIADLNSSYRHFRLWEYSLLTSEDPMSVRESMEGLGLHKSKIDSSIAAYRQTSPENKSSLDAFQKTWNSYYNTHIQFMSAINRHDNKTAEDLIKGSLRKDLRQGIEYLNEMTTANLDAEKNISQVEDRTYHLSQILTALLLALSVLMGIYTGSMITRQIVTLLTVIKKRMEAVQNESMPSLVNAIKALENGNLTVEAKSEIKPIMFRGTDELAQVAKAFNGVLSQLDTIIVSFKETQHSLSHMVIKLQHTAGNVANTSSTLANTATDLDNVSKTIGSTMDQVNTACDHTSHIAGDVAAGAGSQSGSLSEGVHMMNDMTEAIKSVTAAAASAAETASTAQEAASRGSEIIGNIVQGFKTIGGSTEQTSQVVHLLGTSSEQIQSIIQTIETISEQTNLLALNAAIEAARAGEAGRGFGVVADEVRKLAIRVSGSTGEISQLIQEIRERTEQAIVSIDKSTQFVSDGIAMAEQSGAAFEMIVNSVKNATQQAHNIQSVSNEIALDAEKVNQKILDVASVSEQNCASAQQLNATTEEVAASIHTVSISAQDQYRIVSSLVGSANSLENISSILADITQAFIVNNTGETATAEERFKKAA